MHSYTLPTPRVCLNRLIQVKVAVPRGLWVAELFRRRVVY